MKHSTTASSPSPSYLNDFQRRLILDLTLKRINEEQFFRDYPLEPAKKSEEALKILSSSVDFESASDVEFGLYLGFFLGFSTQYTDTLIRLLNADWHQRHEDVVSILDKLKSPAAVDSLYAAALRRHEYAAHDDAHALGVKCIWALGNIGNDAAIGKLKLISKDGNRILRANARKQLIRLGACKRPQMPKHEEIDN